MNLSRWETLDKDEINRVNNNIYEDSKAMRKGNNKSKVMTMSKIAQYQSISSERIREESG